MEKENFQQHKIAKTISEQIEYLHENKRIQFNDMLESEAKDKLLEYNYINVITPFKHKFAKTNDKGEVEKLNGSHVYERDVEFNEYYSLFVDERKKYPTIITNILDFEIHFKTITAYNILISNDITNSDQLELFIDSLKLRFAFLESRYTQQRISHMNKHLDDLKNDIFKYADIYCFFDRMSLGKMLTIFTCLDDHVQNNIFKDLKKYNMTFNVDQIPNFITKVFCLVSIRNCVMHCNSLEILIRFYDPLRHKLRKVSDRKRYINMIKALSIEKAHE